MMYWRNSAAPGGIRVLDFSGLNFQTPAIGGCATLAAGVCCADADETSSMTAAPAKSSVRMRRVLPARRRRLADCRAVARRAVERAVLEMPVIQILVVVRARVFHDHPVFRRQRNVPADRPRLRVELRIVDGL